MPIVYAWKIREGLCCWAHASRSLLDQKEKPSSEAEIKKCMLLEYGDYLRLRNPARPQKGNK